MTQDNMILQHLQAGRSITPLDALNEYGCMRLASVIWRLRKSHSIGRIMERHANKSWARYYMQQEVQNATADNDAGAPRDRQQAASDQGDHAERIQTHLFDNRTDAQS